MTNVNWLEVGFNGMVYFVLGQLWHSQRMFGENWAEVGSVGLGSVDHMPMDTILVHLIGTFILS